jgi:hypothetical protein
MNPVWEAAMSTTIIQEFRADHQRIVGAIVRLRQAITKGEIPEVRRILGSAEGLLGAHFKFEELHLYPALTGFVGEDGVRQLIREHDSIFQGVGNLTALARKETWSDTERKSALESLGLIGDHPATCDDLCQYIAHLPTGEQAALLDHMQALRLQRITFSGYAVERRRA